MQYITRLNSDNVTKNLSSLNYLVARVQPFTYSTNADVVIRLQLFKTYLKCSKKLPISNFKTDSKNNNTKMKMEINWHHNFKNLTFEHTANAPPESREMTGRCKQMRVNANASTFAQPSMICLHAR